MKINYNKEEKIKALQWEFDVAQHTFQINHEKSVEITLYNQDFVKNITVISGYETADDAIGKLFYSTAMWRAGAPATFLILSTGRIWWIKKQEMEGTSYKDIIEKVISNPDVMKEIDSVQTIKAAIDLIL